MEREDRQRCQMERELTVVADGEDREGELSSAMEREGIVVVDGAPIVGWLKSSRMPMFIKFSPIDPCFFSTSFPSLTMISAHLLTMVSP